MSQLLKPILVSAAVVTFLSIVLTRPTTMSIFRNTVWFVKGMREYTKPGFEAAARKFKPEDVDVNVSGRSFLITGANSGIGKETALELAKRGGTVHIACRNLERGEAARSEILSEVASATIHVHRLDIHFSVMHPGWADTPAVRSAMPGFYEKMKDKLRTPGQGADTVVWLAVSQSASQQPSGLFFQDREAVSTHLPLAWTRSNDADESLLMDKLAEMSAKFQ